MTWHRNVSHAVFLVQEDVPRLREDGPALRLPPQEGGKSPATRLRIPRIHRIVVIAAAVHHDPVQILVRGQFRQHIQGERLHLGIRRIQETAAHGRRVKGMVDEHAIGPIIHGTPFLPLRPVIDHPDFETGGLPAAHHHIDPGMDLEPGRMARVDERLEIVEVRRPLAEAPAVPDPAGHLAQRGGHGGSEQHVPAGGPDIHDDVREAHFRDPPAVPADGIGIVPVAPEIRRSVNPEEAGLFFRNRGAGSQKESQHPCQQQSTAHQKVRRTLERLW